MKMAAVNPAMTPCTMCCDGCSEVLGLLILVVEQDFGRRITSAALGDYIRSLDR
jgi:hypothetical protein